MKTRIMRLTALQVALGLALLATFAAPPAVSAGELRPFDAKSLTVIRQTQAGRPFVLAFWSIHCAPCKDEIVLFAALKRKYPHVPILLVAADPPEVKAAVVRFLAGQQLGKIELWAFADGFAERVRYAVDPKWQGELPRTYFFDAAHRATARSGALDPEWVEAWFAQAAPPKAK
jgi:thiol-disulfide isomerase/thioredoxin